MNNKFIILLIIRGSSFGAIRSSRNFSLADLPPFPWRPLALELLPAAARFGRLRRSIGTRRLLPRHRGRGLGAAQRPLHAMDIDCRNPLEHQPSPYRLALKESLRHAGWPITSATHPA